MTSMPEQERREPCWVLKNQSYSLFKWNIGLPRSHFVLLGDNNLGSGELINTELCKAFYLLSCDILIKQPVLHSIILCILYRGKKKKEITEKYLTRDRGLQKFHGIVGNFHSLRELTGKDCKMTFLRTINFLLRTWTAVTNSEETKASKRTNDKRYICVVWGT